MTVALPSIDEFRTFITTMPADTALSPNDPDQCYLTLFFRAKRGVDAHVHYDFIQVSGTSERVDIMDTWLESFQRYAVDEAEYTDDGLATISPKQALRALDDATARKHSWGWPPSSEDDD